MLCGLRRRISLLYIRFVIYLIVNVLTIWLMIAIAAKCSKKDYVIAKFIT